MAGIPGRFCHDSAASRRWQIQSCPLTSHYIIVCDDDNDDDNDEDDDDDAASGGERCDWPKRQEEAEAEPILSLEQMVTINPPDARTTPLAPPPDAATSTPEADSGGRLAPDAPTATVEHARPGVTLLLNAPPAATSPGAAAAAAASEGDRADGDGGGGSGGQWDPPTSGSQSGCSAGAGRPANGAAVFQCSPERASSVCTELSCDLPTHSSCDPSCDFNSEPSCDSAGDDAKEDSDGGGGGGGGGGDGGDGGGGGNGGGNGGDDDTGEGGNGGGDGDSGADSGDSGGGGGGGGGGDADRSKGQSNKAGEELKGDREDLPPEAKLNDRLGTCDSVELARIARRTRKCGKVWHICRSGNVRPPSNPSLELPHEALHPNTASIYLETRCDAFSPALHQFCTNPANPVTIVRGMAGVLGIDLGVFSTKSLVRVAPEQEVEVRSQALQPRDGNLDPARTRHSWLCLSHKTQTTLARYAYYQAQTFHSALAEHNICNRMNGVQTRIFDTSQRLDGLECMAPFRTLKFGTNIDLSDEKTWSAQLAEVCKLPPFMRLHSVGNMLSHVGHKIEGMNTLQLYMKVPGSRTPGHQENNNFCSVNINIGPGECEWFCVPEEHWGVIHSLCEREGVNYLTGSWWPVLAHLEAEQVPLYRFVQRPGDLVWINPGTVHWVQALGWCNNIAWNVGPLTAHQYQLAVERYEWNRRSRVQSIVPMVHLSWNLAQNIRVKDAQLYSHMRYCLQQSLCEWFCTLNILEQLGKRTIVQPRAPGESVYYCHDCEIEVFSLLFAVRSVPGARAYRVYCRACAMRVSPQLKPFTVIQQHSSHELRTMFDHFTLFPANAAS
uniref:[histone H3]-trimethyl-L-lysine(27) demethylase n=1 Tax=Petromyzon marinus TaxID=7757 RepID=A0AAJ7X7R5_PETMA|nr:lysine-specific demethylase 6A-like [Petromyzon marinus]